MAHRTILRKILEPFVVLVAAIYFALDSVVLAIIKPIVRKISRLQMFQSVAIWIGSLGPYQTLVLLLVPLVLLEPTKPLSAYLVATKHFRFGILVLIGGEVLKLAIVERIFHIGRDKLMTIRAFSWSYCIVVGWLSWLESLPPWQAVRRAFDRFKRWARARARQRVKSSAIRRPK